MDMNKKNKKNEFISKLTPETKSIFLKAIKNLEEEGTFKIAWYGDEVCLTSPCFKGCFSTKEALLVRYVSDFVLSGGWVSNAERCKVGTRYMEVTEEYVELWPKVRLHKGSLLESVVKLKEVFIFGNYDFSINFNPKNSLVVDIGAWVGELSIRMARRGARVFSLEPNPYSFEWLERNADLSGVEIETLNAAVGRGEAEFLIPALQREVREIKEEKYTVKSITLNDLMDFWGIEEGDVIRINCCLKRILRGDLEPLRRFKRIIVDYNKAPELWEILVPQLRRWHYTFTVFKAYPYLAPHLEERGVLVAVAQK